MTGCSETEALLQRILVEQRASDVRHQVSARRAVLGATDWSRATGRLDDPGRLDAAAAYGLKGGELCSCKEPGCTTCAFDRVVARAHRETLSAGSGAGTGASGVWINIHAEPQKDPATEWAQLEGLVNSASAHGHLLTLLFSAPWLEFLLDDTTAQDTLADWLRQGHRVGFHHHDVSHDEWDGYQSLDSADCEAEVGAAACAAAPPVSEAFALLEALEAALRGVAAAGSTGMGSTSAIALSSTTRAATWFLSTGNFAALRNVGVATTTSLSSVDTVEGTTTTTTTLTPEVFAPGFVANHGRSTAFRDQEWQAGAVYSQGKIQDNPETDGTGDYRAVPPWCENTYAGQEVPELAGAPLNTGNASDNEVGFQHVLDAVAAGAPSEYVGVSIHAWEYRADYEDPHEKNDDEAIDEFFQELAANGVFARPVQEYLEAECG